MLDRLKSLCIGDMELVMLGVWMCLCVCVGVDISGLRVGCVVGYLIGMWISTSTHKSIFFFFL
jgi:hypothetical protein